MPLSTKIAEGGHSGYGEPSGQAAFSSDISRNTQMIPEAPSTIHTDIVPARKIHDELTAEEGVGQDKNKTTCAIIKGC